MLDSKEHRVKLKDLKPQQTCLAEGGAMGKVIVTEGFPKRGREYEAKYPAFSLLSILQTASSSCLLNKTGIQANLQEQENAACRAHICCNTEQSRGNMKNRSGFK